MAAIKTLYQCPRCSEGITATQRPKHCPNCKYDFGEGASNYNYPLTLSEQHMRLQKRDEYHDALIAMPITKANSVMNDALNIVQVLPAKNVPVSDIRSLVTMAIQIGEIAKKYHEYLIAGGKHVPDLYLTQLPSTQSGDTINEQPKKEAARAEPPTRV
jgi:hypothetical protein